MNTNHISSKDITSAIDNNGYKCYKCGTSYPVQKGNFYKSTYSPLWANNGNYAPVCISCLKERFDVYSQKYGNKWALIYCLAILDIPFVNKVFAGVDFKSETFDLGACIRSLNLTQYSGTRFIDSLQSSDFFDNKQDLESVRWDQKDNLNKTRVLRAVKHDPFVDFSDTERKRMFSLCSDYLSDEAIAEDPHKLKTIVEIIKMYTHIDAINYKINQHMKDTVSGESKIKELNSIKSNILTTINNLSKENGIATKMNIKNSIGNSSLAYHLKEMADQDFTAVQVNMFDIETSKAMQQVANISAKSVLNSMQLTENDFLSMIEQQRKTLTQLNDENELLKEENRQLKMLTSDQEFQKVVI